MDVLTDHDPALDAIVGESLAMRHVKELVTLYSQVSSTVLILGPTGSGKELVARAIHSLGPRRSRPFVAANCASFTAELAESELFGHVRGAFTGAVKDRAGRFRAAEGGTIFLDEIGEMSRAVQAKLLRVFDHGEIVPVGDDWSHKVNVRILAATNRDLSKSLQTGEFRPDLYHRLAGSEIRLPPLAARREDIPALAEALLRRHYGHLECPPTLTRAALGCLLLHDYPGNVRQLQKILEDGIAHANPDKTITERHLFQNAAAFPEATAGTLREVIRLVERELIRLALEENNGNKSKTAKDLGICYRWLLKLMERHGISKRGGMRSRKATVTRIGIKPVVKRRRLA